MVQWWERLRRLTACVTLVAYVCPLLIPAAHGGGEDREEDLRITIRRTDQPHTVVVEASRKYRSEAGREVPLSDPDLSDGDSDDGIAPSLFSQTFTRGYRYGKRLLSAETFPLTLGGLTLTIGFDGSLTCQKTSFTPIQSLFLEASNIIRLQEGDFGGSLTLQCPGVHILPGVGVRTKDLTYIAPKDGTFLKHGPLNIQGTFKVSGMSGDAIQALVGSPDFFADAMDVTMDHFILNNPLIFHGCLNVAADQIQLHANLSTKTTRLETNDLTITHPIDTPGRFEVWESGLKTRDQVKTAHATRFAANTLPNPDFTIHLSQSINAAGGISFLTPRSLVHIGDETSDVAPELLTLKGDLEAYVSKFDMEKGLLTAVNAAFHAPLGLHVGRLVVDSNREVFSTFYCHGQQSGSHNLGGDIENPTYRFLGRTFGNVYDGKHLLRLPVASSNMATVVVQKSLDINAPFQHKGHLRTQHFNLNSHQDSLCEASSLDVEGNCTLRGGGNLVLDRVTGVLNFRYYTYNGTRGGTNATYNFSGSDPAILNIAGKLDSSDRSGVVNKGSILNVSTQNPDIPINLHSYKSSLFQKIIIGLTQERENLANSCSKTGRWFLGFMGQRPTNSINAGRQDYDYAVGFLLKTNNFAGAQQVFPAETSIGGTSVILTNRLEGHVAFGNVLLRLTGNENRLGSALAVVQPESPLQELGLGTYDLKRVTLNTAIRDQMRRDQENRERMAAEVAAGLRATDPPLDRFYFFLRERFWFDEEKALRFYREIKDHLFVLRSGGGGLDRILPGAVLQYTPQMLLDAVRDTCQKVLKRGFVYPNNPLDLEQIKTFHRNMTAYVQDNPMLLEAGSKALSLAGGAAFFQTVTQPVIFYRALVNGEGLDQMVPSIIFPPKMIAESGGVMAESLLAIPASAPTRDLVAHFEHNANVLGLLTQNPAFLALEDETADGSLNQQLTTTTQPLFHNKVILEGPIHVRGNLAIVSQGQLLNHANVNAGNVLLASLGDSVITESTLKRTALVNGYKDELATQASITAQNMLYILALQDVVFRGANTQSGEETRVEAFGNIFDVPLELSSQIVTTYKSKRKSLTTTTSVTTLHPSQHVSGGGIHQRAGGAIGLVAPTITSPRLDLTGNTVSLQNAYSVFQVDETSQSRGRWGRKKNTHSHTVQTTSLPTTLNVPHTTIQSSSDVNLTHPHIHGDMTIEAPQSLVFIRQGQNLRLTQESMQYANLVWNKAKITTTQDITYVPPVIDGQLTVHAQKAILNLVKGRENAWIHHLEAQNTPLMKTYLAEVHERHSQEQQGPSLALSALIAIAITVVTAGNGVAIGSALGLASKSASLAMTQAGIASLSTQMTLSMLSHEGDLLKTLKDITRTEALKSLAFDIATAGIFQGICNQLGISDQFQAARAANRVPSFALQVQKSSIHSLTRTGLTQVLNRSYQRLSFQEALTHVAFSTVLNATAAHGASRIGQAYGSFRIDSVPHKLLHAVNGALIEGTRAALTRGNSSTQSILQAALAGGIGAALAETLAETFGYSRNQILALAQEEANKERQRLGSAFDGEAFATTFTNTLSPTQDRAGDLAKIATALTAFFLSGLGPDPDTHAAHTVAIASHAATNAVENNWAFLVPLIVGGLTIAGVAYTAYEVKEAYDAEGLEGAAKVLGINAAIGVVGGTAVKGGIQATKFVVKSTGFTTTSLREAVNHALNHNPALKEKLGNLAIRITQEAHRFDQKVGSLMGRATGESVHPEALLKGWKSKGKDPMGVGSAGERGQSLLPTQFSKDARDYARHMENLTGVKIDDKQLNMLQIALRSQKFGKLPAAEKVVHGDRFTKSVKDKLIGQWEKNTGKVWPKYQADGYASTGKKIFEKGEPVQAHHIIHQSHGGPHAWWNLQPAEIGRIHQGGLHGSGSIGQRLHGK